ncbi:aminoacyl tRNA synthase complex-interacting multifunctional protein 1-like [Xenia sp. Carnegie-2017]|uniref:aminoacyl tRNA synthase complex-interacting multifunctional protein 1-like n=1 Tax=Xenia sp. Carnegie-2017 TaxID=2897299 RepID=UPI001F03573B|nr:aminoacyl tRNA synthase complex-interacting multifunctional protein 1-like [Xenia sp. Carnegie-2017]
MPVSDKILNTLRLNAKQAEATIALLRKQLSALENEANSDRIESSYVKQKEKLQAENQELRKKAKQLKLELEKVQRQNGIKIFTLPHDKQEDATVEEDGSKRTLTEVEPPVVEEKPVAKEKKPSKKEKPAKPKTSSSTTEENVDVSRLDLRVGKIVKVQKHPDADTLYLEEIDVGEEKPRTVVSGLVKHIPIEKMQDRMVMVLCNLKPAKMRGILSHAMVMCASSPELCELLDPPSTSVPGDKVICEGYLGTPDEQLNPKKKIFEKIQPDLHTDEEGIAKYKGSPFLVVGKEGYFFSQTMKNSSIK